MDQEINEHFGDVLEEFVNQRCYTPGQLEKLTESPKQPGVPKQTIVSWCEGRVRKPRSWIDIVRLARAMRLTKAEANRLLQAAGHKSLTELIHEIRTGADEALIELVSFWSEERPRGAPETLAPLQTAQAAFQAPHPIRGFIGRRKLIGRLHDELVSRRQICVLHGMGGVGKTSLAVHLAYQLRETFPDGVLWANLANVSTTGGPDESVLMGILGTFGSAFGRDLSDETQLMDRSRVVRELLATKQALVVLDNAEHTQAVEPLLPPATNTCAVLITTRNKRMLHDKATHHEVRPFGSRDSLKLLTELIGPERVFTEEKGAMQIAELLEGLPLALRIIGSDLVENAGLTLQEYYELLLDERTRLQYLSDWEDTTKDIRSSFALSFRRLPAALQPLFSSLSLFEGPDFDAEVVASLHKKSVPFVKKQLGQLQALSLVESSFYPGHNKRNAGNSEATQVVSSVRYRQHALLKLFAAEKLESQVNQATEWHQRATTYFIEYANQFGPTDYHQIRAEWENIRGVLQWVIKQELWSDLTTGVAALTQVNLGVVGYLDAQGLWSEATSWLQILLDQADFETAAERATILYKFGYFALRHGNHHMAEQHLAESLVILEAGPLTEDTILGRAYICEWMAQLVGQNHDDSLTWSQRGIDLLRDINSPEGKQQEGYLLVRHSTLLGRSSRYEEAKVLIEQGIALLPARPTSARISGYMTLGNLQALTGQKAAARESWLAGKADAQLIGDHRRLAGLCRNLALQAGEAGQLDEYQKYNERALLLYQQIGDVIGEGHTLANLGYLCTLIGKLDEAKEHLDAAQRIAKSSSERELEAIVHVNLARWYIVRQQLDNAEQALQAAKPVFGEDRPREHAEILRLQAQVAVLKKEFDHALALIGAALAFPETQSDRLEVGKNWRVMGHILEHLGRVNEAVAAYQKSMDFFIENLFEEGRTLLAVGKLYVASSDPKKAKTYLKRGLDNFMKLRLDYYIQQAQELLNSLN